MTFDTQFHFHSLPISLLMGYQTAPALPANQPVVPDTDDGVN